MNTNDVEMPTAEDVQKATEYLNRPETKEMFARFEEAEKRDRALYLDHPNRKVSFAYDFVEAFWIHFRDYYGRSIGDAEMEELLDGLGDDNRLFEMVYDISQELAEKRGWEMK